MKNHGMGIVCLAFAAFAAVADKHIPLSDAPGGSSGAQSFQIAPVADTTTAR